MLRSHLAGLLLLAACLLAPPQVLGVSRFHERNHTGLLFLYGFDDGQVSAALPAQARDFSSRYLMGNLTTSTSGAITWSATRQGMTISSISGGVRATSQQTSASVLPLLSNEFTLEFFFSSPSNPVSQNLLVAGFGDWPPGTPFAPCDAANTMSEGGWRLSSFIGDIIDFSVVLMVSGEPTCVTSTIVITPNTLRHFVARARNGVLSLVSHGSFTTISGSNPTFSPSLWARHAAPLTIASPHATNGWIGTMYMIAMYDRYLSSIEIAANRVFGPPNSYPFGNMMALAAAEDDLVTIFP